MTLPSAWKRLSTRALFKPLALLALLGPVCLMDTAMPAKPPRAAPAASVPPLPGGASPEARLIHVYRLIGANRTRDALDVAEALVRDEPTFRLAHLVYADLITARTQGGGGFGSGLTKAHPQVDGRLLDPLRTEALVRLQALKESPPEGTVPRPLLSLPSTISHAIVVDASRSRLYLLEHRDGVLQLVANYYVSLGKLGIDKRLEGDQRTPTGAYFITSRLDASRLTDFYGAGALQLNYPNDFDRQEKRTGSGIWLHGVPRTNYAREPRATDGCVVLANEDLVALMRQVESGGAPVVIAPKIDWVKPSTLEPGRREAMAFLDTWHRARLASDADTLKSLYTQPSLAKAALAGSSNGRKSSRRERSQLAAAGPVASVLKDVSALHWRDGKELMVVTFGEVPEGATSGNTIRQYWSRESGRWKIFSETTLH